MDEQPTLDAFRTVLLPMLTIFLVPVVAWAALHLIEVRIDNDVAEAVLSGFTAEGGHTAEETAQAQAFAANVRGSAACASDDPELVPFRSALGATCDEYTRLRWLQWIALGSIALGVATALLIAGASVAAHTRRELQVPAFAITSSSLRVVGAIQVLLQGVLVVAVCYYVPAYAMNLISVKLLAVVAIGSLLGVLAALKAIFVSVDLTSAVDGVLLEERDAPHFWARLRALAEKVGTEPPARVVAGIDDNFFVTEHRVSVRGTVYEGRTLFMSLGLLRGMDAAEAEAVLCHELAHFSGGDTEYSRRLGPMRARYVRYLEAVSQNAMSFPVFYVMRAFWDLFSVAMANTSRERELRADRIAAEHTRPDAIARSLLKVAAWSRYRADVEGELFRNNVAGSTSPIAERVRSGFSDFARSNRLAELDTNRVPHPLDSHPSNAERMEALGVKLPAQTWKEVLLAPVEDSWFHRIPVAERVEATLWGEYEAAFDQQRRLRIAVETVPTTPEQVALVEAHFPPMEFPGRDGLGGVRITWQGLAFEDWSETWDRVREPRFRESSFGNKLLFRTPDGERVIPLKGLLDPMGMIRSLDRYRSRALYAASQQELLGGVVPPG